MSRSKILWGVWGVLLLLAPTGGLATDGETTRSVTYAGTGWFEHGLDQGLPYGTSFGPCDNDPLVDDPLSDDPLPSLDESTLAEDPVEEDVPEEFPFGIGGVTFCDIPQKAEVHVQLEDLLLESVTGTLACYRPDVLNFWSWKRFDDETRTQLPSWCGQHANDEPGTTRVIVYLNGPPEGDGATAGKAWLSY